MDKSLSLAEIEANLKTRWLGRAQCPNELWQTIDSTNNRGKELARTGLAAGAMIIAMHQSAGRGRSSNAWHSPPNSGLYLSFIIKPQLAQTDLGVVTLVAGVAVAQAIQSCLSIKVGLKWVNDLILEGKKVGGILVEYVNVSEPILVVGIGLNLHKANENMPADLESKIAFLDTFARSSARQYAIDRNQLVACIANELEIALEMMQSDLQFLLNQWRAYSVTLGQEIMANVGNEKIIGQALDITDGGALIIKTHSGIVNLAAGEISLRKVDGGYA